MRDTSNLQVVLLGLVVAAGMAVPAGAETPPGAKELLARAVAVQGRVSAAPVGAEATDRQAWKPVRQGDELSEGTQVRVGLRSSLLLQFGDDAVVQLKAMTLASLDELYQTEKEKRTKIGLAYGAIRGSVREKALHTDMVIESPAVTCSKEGTHNFALRTMRGSSAWWADGPSEGQIIVRDYTTGRTERVSFGQLVNFLTMTSPAVQRNLFARVVNFYEQNYTSSGEQDFNKFVSTGQTVMGPGQGMQTFGQISGRGAALGGVGDGVPSDLRDRIRQALQGGDFALLFRQFESRFGTGPLPPSIQLRRTPFSGARFARGR